MLHWVLGARLLSVRLELAPEETPQADARRPGSKNRGGGSGVYNGRNWFPVPGLPPDPTPEQVLRPAATEPEPEPELESEPQPGPEPEPETLEPARSSWRSMEYTAPLGKLAAAAAAVAAIPCCAAITRVEVKFLRGSQHAAGLGIRAPRHCFWGPRNLMCRNSRYKRFRAQDSCTIQAISCTTWTSCARNRLYCAIFRAQGAPADILGGPNRARRHALLGPNNSTTPAPALPEERREAEGEEEPDGFFAFNLWWFSRAEDAAARRYEGAFEAAMWGVGGRPHWGKAHRRCCGPTPDADCAAAWPVEWPLFGRVCEALDPTHAFHRPRPVDDDGGGEKEPARGQDPVPAAAAVRYVDRAALPWEEQWDVVVVGAGLSGAALAERHAYDGGRPVTLHCQSLPLKGCSIITRTG
jgi:hypothetical protein